MMRRPPKSTLFPDTTLFRSTVEKASGGKMTIVPIGQAETLSQRNPALTAMDIAEGALGGRPKQPEEEVKTAGVSYRLDRKSTRLNSSHANISYAVFCLKKKK